ncbi:EAL domain-containing protein [Maritimibacter alexandrii]|uniref:EAL domain-containing protein n=1 Tax=Maritimibacter alexandrii TaxID=2570355 RepID=UPI001108D3AB|nr:EAL domain-containing protein [Maritimibacter alexandrii]
MLSGTQGRRELILSHMRNAQVAEGVRAQIDLHLDRVRRRLGFDLVFVARVAGGERRIEAMSAAPGFPTDHRVGEVRALRDCPVVLAAALRDPAAFAGQISEADAGRDTLDPVVGVALHASNGSLFGALGGIVSAPVDMAAITTAAAAMAVSLDLLHDHAVAAQRVRGLLHEVIRERRFYPVFQPIIDVATGDVIYREGLTRLDTTDDTSVPQLLAAAHSVGMGPALELAFARAIIDADEGWGDNAGIAVNLSETTLHSAEFDRFLTQVEPGLTVELTEYEPVRDYRALAGVVARMRAAGLSLAIDDAGAGYTSLRHILDLKPDVLKMDAQLSTRVDTDPEAIALFRTLQTYCDETGTVLVIEGVERHEQLVALQSVGVRYVQGFHLGEPEPRLGAQRG